MTYYLSAPGVCNLQTRGPIRCQDEDKLLAPYVLFCGLLACRLRFAEDAGV